MIGISRITFPGGNLWVRDSGASIGLQVRVRILARDISIALAVHGDSSILNILPAVIEEIVAEPNPAQVLVRMNAGGVPLVGRITRRSVAALQLQPGLRVWAQIKAVALVG
jgi:molybdate transport system ATP-binding protein